MNTDRLLKILSIVLFCVSVVGALSTVVQYFAKKAVWDYRVDELRKDLGGTIPPLRYPGTTPDSTPTPTTEAPASTPTPTTTTTPTPTPTPTLQTPPFSASSVTIKEAKEPSRLDVGLYLSTATSFVTLLGVVVTNWIALRKERRENARAAADFEKVRLENEKLRAERKKRSKPARRPLKPPS
jgi:hypothetical protein